MKMLLPILFLLVSCNERPASYYLTGYDDEIFEVAEKEAHGELIALDDGYTICTAMRKIDKSNYPGLFMGKCGGFAALYLENAIMSGDPEIITNDYALSTLDKFPERKAFFIDIARYRIQKRCGELDPPKSCKNKEMMIEFGL
jgi:hypothetical protein